MKIFFSDLVNEKRWNGGTKAYNLWVNSLNSMGIESYFVTLDGKRKSWLVHVSQSMSVEKMLENFDRDKDLFATGWLNDEVSVFIINYKLPFIYMDLEWHWTEFFMENVKILVKHPLCQKYFTHSYHIQFLAKKYFDIYSFVINEWSDNNLFYYDPKQKKKNYIGYSNEENTGEIIAQLKRRLKNRFRFLRVYGDEAQFARRLRKCEYFLGTNHGKYYDLVRKMRGEGCPRTQQEALHCGCILLAKDVIGNREYLHDGRTGFFIDLNNPNAITDKLLMLEQSPDIKNEIRNNAKKLLDNSFSDNEIKQSQLRQVLDIL